MECNRGRAGRLDAWRDPDHLDFGDRRAGGSRYDLRVDGKSDGEPTDKWE
jgi:hypothetical protein